MFYHFCFCKTSYLFSLTAQAKPFAGGSFTAAFQGADTLTRRRKKRAARQSRAQDSSFVFSRSDALNSEFVLRPFTRFMLLLFSG